MKNNQKLTPWLLKAMLLASLAGPLAADNFRDDFIDRTYSNNDGSENWASDWIETDDDDEITTGIFRVRPDFGLRVAGFNASPELNLSRQLDTSAYPQLSLSYSYRRRTLETDDELRVELSTDGGANWDVVSTIIGTNDDGTVGFFESGNIGISSYASNQMQLRIVPDFDENNDRVIFSYIDINSESCPSYSYGIYAADELEIDRDVTLDNGNSIGDVPTGTTSDNAINLLAAIDNPIISLPPLPTINFNGFANITLNNGDTLAPGNYGTVVVSANAAVSMDPGNYNINFFDVRSDADIAINPGGKVVINHNKFDMDDDSSINENGDAANLTVNYYEGTSGAGTDNKFHLHKRVVFNGIIYSPFNVQSEGIKLFDDVTLTGGIFTAGKIELDKRVEIIYGAAEQAAASGVLGCLSISQATVACNALNKVVVEFSEDVDETTAETIGNYMLNDVGTAAAIDITSATLAGGNTVTLTTNTLDDGSSYFLTANNIENLGGESIGANSRATVTVDCPSPIAEWRFDELDWDDNPVVDSIGPLNGVASGAETDSNGQVCRAGSFDGVDDYITVMDIDSYLVTTASLSFWVKTAPSAAGNNTPWNAPGVTGIEQSGGRDDIFWGWIDSSGKIAATVGNDTAPKSDDAINDGGWHHVVLTRDTASGQLQVFVDGDLENIATSASGDISNGFSSIGRIENTLGSPEYFAGFIDELLIFEEVISAELVESIYSNQLDGNGWDGSARNCPVSGPDRFEINHDGSAIYCQLEQPITVTVKNADGTTNQDYEGTITLNTNTSPAPIGDWGLVSGNGAFDNGAANDGVATYTFSTADDGVASFSLDHGDTDTTTPVSLNISVSDGLISDDDTEGLLVFSESGFSITGSALTAGINPATLPIGIQIAGADFSVFLTAYGTTADDPVCGVIEAYNGDKNITFSHNYVDPGSGSITPTIDVAGVDTNIGAAMSINFSSGQAEINSFKYKDVGKLNVAATDGTLASGDSNNFVVRPFRFDISVDGDGNIGATDAAGDVFHTAGKDFDIDVEVHDAEGSITPNFGNESTNEAVLLTVSPQLPATAGVLTGGLSKTSAGVYQGTFDYDEVGIITLTASTDANYIDSGETTSTDLANVGRFKPAYFLVEADAVDGLDNRTDTQTQASCSDSFSFLDEEFTLNFSITAKEQDGKTTVNYQGSFAKLQTTLSLGDANGNSPNSFNVVAESGANTYTPALKITGSAPALTMVNGVDGNVAMPLRLIRNAGLQAEAPLLSTTLAVNPIDADGVESNGTETIDMGAANQDFTVIDSTDFYFGRIVIESANGSELADLPVWSHTQYCAAVDGANNCSTWLDMSRRAPVLDRCSQIAIAESGATSWPAGLAYLGAWLAGTNYDSNLDRDDDFLFQSFDGLQNRGGGGFLLRYTAGAAGGEYSLPELTAPTTVENYHPYLLLLPGQITFGTYRGHDEVIYWRERE